MSEYLIVTLSITLIEDIEFHLYCLGKGIMSYYDKPENAAKIREPHKNEFR